MKRVNDCKNQNYLNYIHLTSPRTKEKRTLIRAFWVGGFICCIGQGLRYLYEYAFNLSGDELASYVSMTLIFLSALISLLVFNLSPIKTILIFSILGVLYKLLTTPKEAR